MMLNHKRVINLILPIIMIIILTSGIGLPNVYASTETDLGSLYMGNTSNYNNSPQYRYLAHSSGKTVTVSYTEATYSNIQIDIVSSTGVILSSQTIAYAVNSYNGGLSLGEIDSIYFIVVIAFTVNGGQDYVKVYKFNINTYTYAVYNSADVAGFYFVRKTSKIFEYNSKYYWLFAEDRAGGTNYLTLWEYNPSGNTVTLKGTPYSLGTADARSIKAVLGFQDPDNDRYLYIYTSATATPQPVLYKVDLEGFTITIIATAPTSGGYAYKSDATYSYPNIYITFMGGGIATDGANYYLWLTHVYSSNTTTIVREAIAYTWLLEFSSSNISSGTLSSQSAFYDISIDSSGATYSEVGTSWGYTENDNTELVLYVVFEDISGTKDTSVKKYQLLDISSMPTSFDTEETLSDDGNDYITFKSAGANVAKDPQSSVSYQEVTASNAYVYTGENMLYVEYTSVFAMTPNDSPKLTNKQYLVTWTISQNGILDTTNNTRYKVYVDNIQRTAYSTYLINGIGQIYITVVTTGVHTFYIKLYDSTGITLLYTSDVDSVTFAINEDAVGGDFDTDIMMTGINQLIYALPAIFIILTPAFMLMVTLNSQGLGGYGFIAGSFIGTITGVWGGILPTSAIYLIGLIVIVIAVMVWRGSNNNASSGGV